ncbi:beta-ketoacyl-ACP synthase III [Nocardia sp. JMUB6875]
MLHNNDPRLDCYCGCALADSDHPAHDATTSLGILGTGSRVPDRVVSNGEIAPAAQVDEGWVRRKTGILERRWADPGEATSDLAAAAGRNALQAAGIRAGDLSLIIVATSTPDSPVPPTACHVQRQLSACNAVAFDINAVCSGFVFALSVAQAMLASLGGYGLVIGADVYSRTLNPADRKTVVLFGDGAGAVVIGKSERSMATLRGATLFSFGDLADLIRVPAGGSRIPYTPAIHDKGLHYFTMDGHAVRSFVLDWLPHLVGRFLKQHSIAPEEVRHIVAHQANTVMLDDLFPRLGLPNATMHQTAAMYGNTAAASIPLTLDQAARSRGISSGDLVLLAGFGGGMSVGLSLIRWS